MQRAAGYDLSYTQNRELSWLKFNERVLAQAADPAVPLIERLRFLAIFTSNLDEFFMVRVGRLSSLAATAPDSEDNKSGLTPGQQLKRIHGAVRPLLRRRDEIFREVSAALSAAGAADVPLEALDGDALALVRAFYRERLRPLLSPWIVRRDQPLPPLQSKALYAAALLSGRDGPALGLAAIPEAVPPLVMLPGSSIRYVRTESVVAAHLKALFSPLEVRQQAIVCVTRSADLAADMEASAGDGGDCLQRMETLLREREQLSPVRLEVQGHAPALSETLASLLKLSAEQVFACECPLKLDYAYLLNRCPAALYNEPHRPADPRSLNRSVPVWEQLRRRDILLFYPYQSMRPMLDLLRQSARDPQVASIQITIYRLARPSIVAGLLCDAARNGKEVTVLLELRARFDEQSNIDWARALQRAGCRVLYGPERCKCHAKLCLIARRERGRLSYVTQIGTGNYNEQTAAHYTDFCLMTADEAVARDAVAFFESLRCGRLSGEYETLMVAPHAMKKRLAALIDGEIAKGRRGRIIIKANSVTERELIDKLCEASCAGVRIDLIVRGICCLLPGVPGRTENIAVTSIIGRFLEHSRVYAFGEGAAQQIYLSSADIMARNQTRRVEIACPVRSGELRAFLSDYLNRLLADDTHAWRMRADGDYDAPEPRGGKPIDAQAYYSELAFSADCEHSVASEADFFPEYGTSSFFLPSNSQR